MRPIAPDLGFHETVMGQDQLLFNELPAEVMNTLVSTDDGKAMHVQTVRTRWKLSDAERERVAAGEDLYISQLTFGKPMQPVQPQIGREGLEADGHTRRVELWTPGG